MIEKKWKGFSGGWWNGGGPSVRAEYLSAYPLSLAHHFRVTAGLIAYSEATRYTSAKRLEAEAWCRAHEKRLGQYLLYPRTKGFIACVQNLRKTEHVSAVYDVTIAYAKNDKEFLAAPRFTETLMLPNLDERWRFFVHVERYAIAELPQSDAELARWLEDRWVDKGQRLAHLRKLLLDGQKWDESSLSGLRLD